MNISYNWLKDLIAVKMPPNETADALTRVGLTVEGVHPFGDDFVFDIDLTSNRSDCLSHLGVARELGVIIGKPIVNEETAAADLNSEDAVSIFARLGHCKGRFTRTLPSFHDSCNPRGQDRPVAGLARKKARSDRRTFDQ